MRNESHHRISTFSGHNKKFTIVHAPNGIRTGDPSVQTAQDYVQLRLFGHTVLYDVPPFKQIPLRCALLLISDPITFLSPIRWAAISFPPSPSHQKSVPFKDQSAEERTVSRPSYIFYLTTNAVHPLTHSLTRSLEEVQCLQLK
jgi:hypothetical protein